MMGNVGISQFRLFELHHPKHGESYDALYRVINNMIYFMVDQKDDARYRAIDNVIYFMVDQKYDARIVLSMT